VPDAMRMYEKDASSEKRGDWIERLFEHKRSSPKAAR
jgi:hypothetical protein